jgi:release factor glutamine methyltransferase
LSLSTPLIHYSNQTIADLIEQGTTCLLPLSDSAKLDIQILLAFVLDKETSYLLTWPEKVISTTEFECFITLFNRRIKGEPIAYILQEREFWSLPFYVSPATLIPRPDTEILVENIIERHQENNLNCLDLGTGTGAIALALASEKSTWNIDAIDFSADAITLAKRNAKRLGFQQVRLYQSDWFSNIEKNRKFEIIVSNPPYIDENDKHLFEGDVRFEPSSALVSGDNGLADIKHIAQEALHYLVCQGTLYIEHGYQQAKLIQHLLIELGYVEVETIKDYSGNDRVTCGRYLS